MVTFTVPQEYGYVVLTAVGTCFLGFWHGARVTSFRKAAGLSYPTPYADSAQMSEASAERKQQLYLFNCVQRAHGNYLENHPAVLVTLLIAGLKYPITSSLLGLGWSASRIAYAVGYTSQSKQGGKGRMVGAPFWLFQLGIFGLAAMVGYSIAF